MVSPFLCLRAAAVIVTMSVMRAMTEPELDQSLVNMQPLLGCRLRQFRYNEKVLQLQFVTESQSCWLTFSMKPGTPYIFSTEQRIHLVKNVKKPMALFLKTHFLDRQLSEIYRDQEKGRWVVLKFESQQGLTEIHLSLIPGRINIEAVVGDKVVYAFKPSELKPHSDQNFQATHPLRDHSFFYQQWLKRNEVLKKSAPVASSNKDLKKKRQGLEKMQSHLKSLQASSWQMAGEFLKESQNIESALKQWPEQIDGDQSLAWNIENCFSHVKKNQTKILGTEQRIEELKAEIAALEKGEALVKKPVKTQNLLYEADLRGKTVSLPEGRLFVGKSGAENLKLLRKAKPWYFWLHIKDYPGAYGILERNKGQKVSSQSLQKAAVAVIDQSLPKGQKGLFDVIYAECRYVRPIKGAKSGQVTYSHEKVLTIKVDS